jgi:putative colanic acid biosynthesis glycosyltransferase
MTTKTLSIITVTLNNLSGLTQTAASINAQTDTDFEWIIIDGGSTDGTLAFLKPQSP